MFMDLTYLPIYDNESNDEKVDEDLLKTMGC
jgi:hypothetical protein